MASWNAQNGISKMPATSGTDARNGPKKRPMKMPGMPQVFTKRSPRGISSGCRDSGQTCATEYSSLSPIQYDSQSPSAAPSAPAIHTGQKLMPLEFDQRADRHQRAPGRDQQRNEGERLAEASANTIGGAQAACRRTNSVTC